MTRTIAYDILIKDGWNEDGANEIILTLEECEMLEDMTEEDLLNVSEDYKDR